MDWSGPEIPKKGKIKEKYASSEGHKIKKSGGQYELSHPDSLISVRHKSLERLINHARAFPGPDDKFAF